ncbi:MAG: FAD-dependent oxidoreductase [bacterium]
MTNRSNRSDVVVIGGVAAGPKAAATLARRRPSAAITLFQREDYLSYATCGFPFFASGEVGAFDELLKTSWGAVRDGAYFQNAKGFTAVTGAEVLSINRGEKTVAVKMLDTGDVTAHGYDKLVIATGSTPNAPPMPVPTSECVRPFTRPADVLSFRGLAERGDIDNVVIIGGGFIGVELCEAVKDMWGIGVTLFEKQPQLLPYMLDPEMAAIVRRSLERDGVGVFVDAAVEGIDLDGDGKPVVSVAGRDPAAADYVFLCLGVHPEVTLARECGLEIGETGGIAVDRYLRTSDPDIYAGGDCVESRHRITGHPIYLPLGSIANRHGRVIGENLAGCVGAGGGDSAGDVGEGGVDGEGGNDGNFAGNDGGLDGEMIFPGVFGAFVLRAFETNIGGVGLSEEAARREGFHVRSVWGSFPDRPDYNPEVKTMTLKMVYEDGGERLLGLQAVGKGDIARRVDVFSSLLQHEADVEDIFDFEHGYAPPFSEALDPLHHLAGIARAVGRGVEFVGPGVGLVGSTEESAGPGAGPMGPGVGLVGPGAQFMGAGRVPDDAIVLDVREPEEAVNEPLPSWITSRAQGVVSIPLVELKARQGELDRKRPVFVICRRGPRSYQAALILEAAGFGRVTIIAAGLQAQS